MDQVHIEMVLYMLINYTYFLFISLCIFYLCNVIKYYYIVCMHSCIYKNGIYSPKHNNNIPCCLDVVG